MVEGQPIGLVASGHSPGPVVMLGLIHGMTPQGYAWEPPTMQQQLEASLLMGLILVVKAKWW